MKTGMSEGRTTGPRRESQTQHNRNRESLRFLRLRQTSLARKSYGRRGLLNIVNQLIGRFGTKVD
jgi:hypothetical protein